MNEEFERPFLRPETMVQTQCAQGSCEDGDPYRIKGTISEGITLGKHRMVFNAFLAERFESPDRRKLT